jgi:hypothetical protein
MAGLLVKHGCSLYPAIVLLEAAALQVDPRDRDSCMPVGQDIELDLEIGLGLSLQDLL